jgi:hypothetical protein
MSSLAAFGGRRWRPLAAFQSPGLDQAFCACLYNGTSLALVQTRSLENRQTPPTTTAKRRQRRHFIFIESTDIGLVPHLKKRKTDLRNMGRETFLLKRLGGKWRRRLAVVGGLPS